MEPVRKADDLGHTILEVLSEGDGYGYQICKKIRETRATLLNRGEAIVYPTLYRLEDVGLIRAAWQTVPTVHGAPRRRRVYQLTRKGYRRFLKMTDEG